MDSKKVLVITDICDEGFIKMIKEKYENCTLISPDTPIKPCIGCLGCWFRTPGVCVLNDDYCHMGKKMSDCDTLLYISRCCFGGFSPYVKNVIDRSISYVLPSFKKRGAWSGHFRRYKNKFDYLAVFYGDDITEEEKITASALCKGNALLWNCNEPTVRFCSDYMDAEGLLP